MGAKPAFQEPGVLLPVHEAEIRREYAIAIESEIRANPTIANFKLNAAQVAVILSVPLSALRPGGYLSSEVLSRELRQRLVGLPSLVKRFLDQPLTSKKGGDPDDKELLPLGVKRSASEASKCAERDGNACLMIGTGEPRVCHVVPYTWSNNQVNIQKTEEVLHHIQAFFGESWLMRYRPYLLEQFPGGSDKVWNMLCLDSNIYLLWKTDARFGFKCLDIRPTTDDRQSVVILQLNWMPRRAISPTRLMSLQGQDNDFDEMVECAKSFHQNGSPHSIRDLSGFPITSGRLIHVPMPSSEAVHLKAMIDLQWAMIVVAAFCGAGGPPQLLPGHEDVDDLDSRIGERVEAHFERHGWTRSRLDSVLF